MPQQTGSGGFNWPVLLQALSTVAPQIDQSRQREAAANDIYRGMTSASQRQQQIDQRIGDELTATGTDDATAQRSAALADYTQALQQARARGSGVSEVASNALGETYERGTADARQATAQRSGRRAGQMATVQGSRRMREQAGQRRGRMGAEIDTQRRMADGDIFLAELQARQRRPNPWVQLLGQIGSTIATNYDWEPGAGGGGGARLPSVGGGTPVVDIAGGYQPGRGRSA